jgi:hypothetical protein
MDSLVAEIRNLADREDLAFWATRRLADEKTLAAENSRVVEADTPGPRWRGADRHDPTRRLR